MTRKQYLDSLNLSIGLLAKKSGVSPSTVIKWIAGKPIMIKLEGSIREEVSLWEEELREKRTKLGLY